MDQDELRRKRLLALGSRPYAGAAGFLGGKPGSASSHAYSPYTAPSSREVIDLTGSSPDYSGGDDDEASLRLAMELDAQFKAEAGIADPGPLPYSPPRRAYSQPGPASLVSPIDGDERLALQLQAEFNRENEEVLLFEEPRPLYEEAPNFASSETEASMDSVSFHDFTREVKGRSCTHCRIKFLQAETDVGNYFKQWTNRQCKIAFQ